MSGARLDLGQPDLALAELQVPELDPHRAFEWSPELFAAQAEVLEELKRADEASVWRKRAEVASAALAERSGENEAETIEVFEILEIDDEEDIDDESSDADSDDAEGSTETEDDDQIDDSDDDESLDDATDIDGASDDAADNDMTGGNSTDGETLDDATAGQER
jgi:hypothetical protein